MQALVTAIASKVRATLTEVITLRRSVKKHAADKLAYFDRRTPITAPPKPLKTESNTSDAVP